MDGACAIRARKSRAELDYVLRRLRVKIAVFGAGGSIGHMIVREALARGHEVRAVVRDASHFTMVDPRLTVVHGDAADAGSIAATTAGVDAVVNAVSPRPSKSGKATSSLTVVARAFIAGLPRAGVTRLIIIGGAGSLLMPNGKMHVDEPDFPDIYKPEALAQRDALDVYRAEAGALDWTYISPAEVIMPAARTGQYRVGGNHLLVDAKGKSLISIEDYAVAVVDLIERPAHLRERITIAY
jgi:putative NADH-flavin reductase